MLLDNTYSEWELYVWPIYNYLINEGKKIIIVPIKENWILWTPQELDYFLQKYEKFK